MVRTRRRIEGVATRFAALKHQWRTEMLEAVVATPHKQAELEARLEEKLLGLDDDLAFIRTANKGGEFMAEESKARVREIATRQWRDAEGVSQPLLTDDEVYNLCIERGTLR